MNPAWIGKTAVLAVLLVAGVAVAASTGYAQHPAARDFASEAASRHGLDAGWVLQQLAQARRQTSVQRLMMPAPPGQPKNWAAYRDRFVEPRRIGDGVAFWNANAATLARAEARFGVPADIVVGIIGVETFYGRIMGRYRVLDALATLAFDFPEGRSDRSAFFRDQLLEFLLLTRRDGVAPTSVTGSFAGAMGLPQFMPGSVNRYAIDFDGDAQIDLRDSAADAIGSVAHFLAEHGWQRGMPTHFEVTPPGERAPLARLLAPDIVPSFGADEMVVAGAVLPDAARAHAGALSLVMVENGEAPPSYVAGTQNFYVLTRYNRSSYYARAVIALGEAVRLAR